MKRDSSLDIAKGLLIILMVVGHSGCPEHLNRAIYLFHMPAFFFISGMLLNDKYFSDFRSYLLRKLRGIYFPFVKWSILFLVLHNVFFWLHIYSVEYDLVQHTIKVARILTMTDSEQLLGGFWFLKELFYASIISWIVLASFGRNSRGRGGQFCIPFIFAVAACILSLVSFKIPAIGSKTMLACSYFTFGYIMRHWAYKISGTCICLMFLLLLTCPLVFYGEMGTHKGLAIFGEFLVSIFGSIFIVALSKRISTIGFANTLSIVGQATLYILVFHFLSFKIVSIVVITVKGLPLKDLSEFPVLSIHLPFLWMLYSIIGVIVPLVIWLMVNRVMVVLTRKNAK